MELVELGDGLRLWIHDAMEARILHHEILDEGIRERDGIELRDGDTVVDVGANIGLFSVACLRRRERLRVVAFEPEPTLCAIARRNLELHGATASVAVHQCALGAESGTAVLHVDRYASFSATTRPSEVAAAHRHDRPASAWVAAALRDGARLGLLRARTAERLIAALSIGLVRPVVELAGALSLLVLRARSRAGMRRVVCPVRTLSEVLAEEGIGRIDLLKVDVEGSEQEVLDGLSAPDWGRIRQVVVEVHDVAGRLERIAAMLRERGFAVAVERSGFELSSLLGIATLVAIRAESGPASRGGLEVMEPVWRSSRRAVRVDQEPGDAGVIRPSTDA